MDREAWRAEVHGVTKSQTWLSDWTELNVSLYLVIFFALNFTFIWQTFTCHTWFSFWFWYFFVLLKIVLFSAARGLCCCMGAVGSGGELGALFAAVHGLLIAVASRCGAPALGRTDFSSWGSWAYLPRGMCDLPRPGIESVSSVLAGRFLITGPPGKSYDLSFLYPFFCCQTSPIISTINSQK